MLKSRIITSQINYIHENKILVIAFFNLQYYRFSSARHTFAIVSFRDTCIAGSGVGL